MHEIGDVATRAGGATARFVSANAIPLSLIGLGATWLALSMRRQRSVERDYLYAREYGYDYEVGGYSGASYDERYDEPTSSTHLGEIGYTAGSRGRTSRARSAVGSAKQRVGDATHRAASKLGNVRDQARERIGNVAGRVTETGSHLGTQVRDRAADLGHRASDLSHEARERLRRAELDARDFAQANPLAVGAAAIAAGVGVGLLLPATRKENELLGPTRTRLMDQGKHLISDAKDGAERVGRSAKSAVQEVKSSISEST
jgi:hypothetical protein